MANKFATMQVPNQSHGQFDFNSMHTTTMDFGRLTVAKIIECVPGDTINLNMDLNLICAPNPAPINGKITLAANCFYVRNNLIMREWDNYILGLSNPTLPYMTWLQMIGQKLNLGNEVYDTERYVSGFGINITGSTPPTGCSNLKISALPFRAVNRIVWDWYRDKQRVSDASISSYVTDTAGACSNTEVTQLIRPKYRLFPKNYINTAFSQPQENNPAAAKITRGNANNKLTTFGTDNDIYTGVKYNIDSQGTALDTWSEAKGPNDITTELSTTIQGIRGANALQRWLEVANVAGKNILSRFAAFFGTRPSDAILDMSEWIGGTTQDFTWSNTTATSSGNNDVTETSAPAYNNAFGLDADNMDHLTMAGQILPNGYCNLQLKNINYHTAVHGYFVVILSALPVMSYATGLPSMLTRGTNDMYNSRFSFYQKEFEGLGMEPVLMQDVLTPVIYGSTPLPSGATYSPLGVFGYQPKYQNYKYDKDIISGDYVRSNTIAAMRARNLARDLLFEHGYTNYDGSVKTGGTNTDINTTITPSSVVTCGRNARIACDNRFTISSPDYDHFDVNCKFAIKMDRQMTENDMPSLERMEQGSYSIETGGKRL